MHWYGGFWFVGWLIVIGVVVLALRRGGCYGAHRWRHQGRVDAEAVLQRRLAGGEIDEAEYRRLRDILAR